MYALKKIVSVEPTSFTHFHQRGLAMEAPPDLMAQQGRLDMESHRETLCGFSNHQMIFGNGVF